VLLAVRRDAQCVASGMQGCAVCSYGSAISISLRATVLIGCGMDKRTQGHDSIQ
jgi:hypothetical protein